MGDGGAYFLSVAALRWSPQMPSFGGGQGKAATHVLHLRSCSWPSGDTCNWSGRPKSQIFRPPFNRDAPNVARTSMPPTYYAATPDMTSPATSDRYLLKLEKRLKMPHPTALGRSLVVQRFACPTSRWASFSIWKTRVVLIQITSLACRLKQGYNGKGWRRCTRNSSGGSMIS